MQNLNIFSIHQIKFRQTCQIVFPLKFLPAKICFLKVLKNKVNIVTISKKTHKTNSFVGINFKLTLKLINTGVLKGGILRF